jgi:hypothetical protein
VRGQNNGKKLEQSIANQVTLDHAISVGNVTGQELFQDLRKQKEGC